MKILLAGGTGFIGNSLVTSLATKGHDCHVLVRRPVSEFRTRPRVTYVPYENLGAVVNVDAVVNLAGEWVVGRWTAAKRQRIMDSRVKTTRQLVDWMERLETRPAVFLSGSAVGYYGDRPGEVLTEESPPDPASRFRCQVCQAWEHEASRAESLGTRTVYLRIGNVLDPSQGFLGSLLPWLRRAPILIPFAQDVKNPWISIRDTVRLLEFALANDAIAGPLNVVSPSPTTTRTLVRIIGRAVQRPVIGRIPDAVIRVIFGEFSQSFIESQDVRPAKAISFGFQFLDVDLESYLIPAIRQSLDIPPAG